ncbi:MAG: hypothetical protein ACI9DF_005373, partial [Verrucomicrobiales bacterium]
NIVQMVFSGLSRWDMYMGLPASACPSLMVDPRARLLT